MCLINYNTHFPWTRCWAKKMRYYMQFLVYYLFFTFIHCQSRPSVTYPNWPQTNGMDKCQFREGSPEVNSRSSRNLSNQQMIANNFGSTRGPITINEAGESVAMDSMEFRKMGDGIMTFNCILLRSWMAIRLIESYKVLRQWIARIANR